MQSITRKLQPSMQETVNDISSHLGWVFGWVLLASLLLHGFVGVAGTLRRFQFAREQRSLTRERLALEIKTAQARCRQAEQEKLHWNGFRKFQVARKEAQCDNVFSFYLTPHDRKPLPSFKPGQYLTFQLDVPGQDRPLIRCYSLSDSPARADYYRVTIKKILPAEPGGRPGLASSYFADHVKEGDILNVKAPSGHFYLDLERGRPVVLVGAGVGITPVLSMLKAIVDANSRSEAHFFFGVRNGQEHIHKSELQKIAAEHENVRLHVCYSRPSPRDQEGVDYRFAERVSVDLFKRVLPSGNYDFFLCGPAAMMESIVDGLKQWGVPDQSIFYEAFGPATVKKVAPPLAPADAAAPMLQVTFSRSNKVCAWNPAAASLLELAEANGVRVDSGCRAGNCGSCLVAVKSGAVEYVSPPGSAAEEGSCLTCIAKPKGSLVLDA